MGVLKRGMSRRLVVFMLGWVTQGREVWHKWFLCWHEQRELTPMHYPESHGLHGIHDLLP